MFVQYFIYLYTVYTYYHTTINTINIIIIIIFEYLYISHCQIYSKLVYVISIWERVRIVISFHYDHDLYDHNAHLEHILMFENCSLSLVWYVWVCYNKLDDDHHAVSSVNALYILNRLYIYNCQLLFRCYCFDVITCCLTDRRNI